MDLVGTHVELDLITSGGQLELQGRLMEAVPDTIVVADCCPRQVKDRHFDFSHGTYWLIGLCIISR